MLSLPVEGDECSIEDCLAAYFRSEVVHDYKDERTGRYVKATKKLSLEKLPNILILNLKRFIYK